MDAPLRVGVLSFAHGHVGVYVNVMKNFDDVKLVSAYDENPERAKPICKEAGMTYTDRMTGVLDNPDIDAVMIGVETNRHAEFVEAAAQAGKHILLQKPMALTLEDCDRIIKAVKEARVEFALAWQMRQDSANIRIRELVQTGELGRIAVVRRRHCIGVLLSPEFLEGPTKWHVDAVKNKGMFMDDASHAADWFYWIFGRPVSVMAEIDNIVTDIAPDDNGVALYRFRNREIGILLNSSVVNAAENTTEIYGDKGVLIHNYGDGPSTHVERPANAPALKYMRYGENKWLDQEIAIPAGHVERLQAIPRPWVDSLLHGGPKLCSAEEGRISTEMILGAYQSAQEGRRVEFPL